jgi:hypothetical protein
VWTLVQDQDIIDALANAATAQATANGKVLTYAQDEPPANLNAAENNGDIWMDTNDDNKLYRYAHPSWVSYAQETADWTKVYGSGRPADNATRNNWRGVWASGTTYNLGDVAVYATNGSAYVYVNASSTSGNLPTVTSYWAIYSYGGYNNVTLVAYKRQDNIPTDTPSTTGAITYNFTTGAWTPDDGWSTAIPSGDLNLYTITALAVSPESTVSIAASGWTSPRKILEQGQYRDIIFTASTTGVPLIDNDNSSPPGWSDTIPPATGTIFQSIGIRNLAGVLVGTWSTPVVYRGQWRGAYASNIRYFLGDMVSYISGSFICLNPIAAGIINAAPASTFNANSNWDVLAQVGATGPAGAGSSASPITDIQLNGDVSPLEVTATVTTYNGSGTATTTLSPVVTGGEGALSYVWARTTTDVSSITNSSTTASTLTLSHTASPGTTNGVYTPYVFETWKVTITDSNGSVVSNLVEVKLRVFAAYVWTALSSVTLADSTVNAEYDGSAHTATISPVINNGSGNFTKQWLQGPNYGVVSTKNGDASVSGSATEVGDSFSQTWKSQITDNADSIVKTSGAATLSVTIDACFERNTRIWMGDGSYRLIRDLVLGDVVKSFTTPTMIDESDPTWRDWTQTDISNGTIGTSVVTATSAHTHMGYFIINQIIRITGKHPVLTKRAGVWQWVFVANLTHGDYLLGSDKSEIEVTMIEEVIQPIYVISLGVENNDTYFGGDLGGLSMLVHNK